MNSILENPWMNALFGDPEVAALFSAETSLRQMLKIEAAWTHAIAPAQVAARLEMAFMHSDVTVADLTAGMAQDGVPIPALVRHLKQSVAPADHAFVHSGLTSQDVIDTSLMMGLQALFPILEMRLNNLIAALNALSDRDGANEIMAVTRMQPALAITAADRITTWRRPLEDLLRQLPALAERCSIVQLGGPVGTRGPKMTDTIRCNFAAFLGLRDLGYAWHNDRTILAEAAALLARMTGVIGKIGQDIAMMALNSQDELTLTGGGGSSAMPHKQNPVRAEILITLARRNAGDLAQMHHALTHEFERSGSAWMLEWLTLPAMAETCGCSLITGAKLIEQITSIGAHAVAK